MAAHRYWRVRVLTNFGGSNANCRELVLRETPGGASLTATHGGTPLADSSWAGYPVSYAFDGTANFWAAGGGGAAHWLGWDFGAGKSFDVAEISWTTRGDGYANESPQTWVLEYSDNGSAWSQKMALPTQAAWGIAETRTIATALGSVAGTVLIDGAGAARMVRIYLRSSGALLAETTSAADGSFSFSGLPVAEVYVLALDAAKNAVIADRIMPAAV